MDVCEHCGPCGRNAEYAVCVRCHEPHCPEHYYTPGSEPKWPYLPERNHPLPPEPWQYVRWGHHRVGPGCTKCLREWAEDEEARLRGLIDGAGHEVRTVLQAVRHWPGDFPSPVSAELGRRWAAAAYERHGHNQDLVLVSVTPKPPAAGMPPQEGIVREIKRTPACLSKRNGQFGFTPGGDVFHVDGSWVSVEIQALVLVDRGKSVITGKWSPPGPDDDPGAASFYLQSGRPVRFLPDWVSQARYRSYTDGWQAVADSLLAD